MSDLDLVSFESIIWERIKQIATSIFILTLAVSLFSPIIVTPIYISVFRSNRVRDQATPVYPITYYFYKMVHSFYLTHILMFTLMLHTYFEFLYYVGPAPIILGLHLVHVHHILIAFLAIQRFLLYFFPNLEKTVSFGFKATTRIIYFIHFLCFLPFLACVCINMIIGITHGNIYDMKDAIIVLITTYNTALNCIVISSTLLYIPIQISIFRLRHLPSIEKQKPHKYILYQTIIMVCFKIVQVLTLSDILHDYKSLAPSLTDIFVTPSLVTIPYLFCNRRNVKEMRKRLSLKYLWSKLNNRSNRVGGIDNEIAISYIQSTNI